MGNPTTTYIGDVRVVIQQPPVLVRDLSSCELRSKFSLLICNGFLRCVDGIPAINTERVPTESLQSTTDTEDV